MTLLNPSPTTGRGVDQIVVASVPAGHVYVRHLSPAHGPGPRRLADPDPAAPDRAATQRWWPPVMLDPGWAATADFDLFHLQFGFDARSPEHLADLVDALRRRGKPFVFTVHDLRNPHHPSRELHDEQLDVLIPAADALVTLTDGAADEIRLRWGREAVVLPHPHVVDLRTMAVAQDARARRRNWGFRIGLHVKSLRASMDPMAVLPTLVETVRSLPGAVLQVNGHRDVLDDDGARRDAPLGSYLRERAAAGELELHVHDYFSEPELFNHLGSLDVSVLPYRFGTHSGWLEACRDLGTTVVAPTCGYFADQGPVLSYRLDEDGYDADSLAAAIVLAYETRPRLGAAIDVRRHQRAEVAQAHDLLYRSLVRTSRGRR
ncbi:glycosyltransferase family 1 protein [Nocardioides sp. W7]|uniref:glycosyltransferase family 1 protein n=1 Tax=Nocardioides sp. W7 TaxID=2931390 RepID=UPI001FD5DFAA|nr:glycosyltransferase family 1 protein [Nocardioides sp. W7]